MKPYFHASAKRSTAFMLLLLWLFALAAGAANACGLVVQGASPHEAGAHHASASQEAIELAAGYEGAMEGHHGEGQHGDTDVSKASCLKVCDDASHSLLKQEPGFDEFDYGIARFSTRAWTDAKSLTSSPSWGVHLRPLEVGLSARIRYSRLTQ